MKKLLIEINQIKCQGCVDKITKAIKKIKAVKLIEINLTTKTANLEYDSTKVDWEKIKETITKIGYSPVIKA